MLTFVQKYPPKPRAAFLRRLAPALAGCTSLLLAPVPEAVAAEAATAPTVQTNPGFFTGLFGPSRRTLLGDLGGVRPALAGHGVTVDLNETSEVLSNIGGGVERGTGYLGVALITLGVDTEKAFGLQGGRINVSFLNSRGRNFSADKLDSLQTASGNEADSTTRLWEAWYQQSLFADAVSLRVGQQALDQEFIGSHYADLLLNAAMGWPVLPSADLFAGGPADPLSSLGLRLEGRLANRITLRAGVFNDNPPGGRFNDDSALRGAERHGLRFNLNTGALFIGEVEYATVRPAKSGADNDDDKAGPATIYKLGFWIDTARFPDQRFDDAGLSLADPASGGIGKAHKGNFSLYGIIDQLLWQAGPDSPQAIALFARVMGAPSDRNLVDFSLNLGFSLSAPFDSRPNDAFAVGYGLARISNRARGLDRDSNLFNGTSAPVRSAEHLIEITYQYQVAPWWQLQPDFQYLINPGAGIVNRNNAGEKLRNEAVVGLRTSIAF